MIKFPCNCGHNFAVEDDMAGGLIQCPRCGRLNDVPTLSALKELDSDGTYKMDDVPVAAEPGRLEKLQRTYTRQRIDEEGNEIDLRSPPAVPVPGAGVEEIPLAGEEEQDVPRVAPKYDPVTGELIREFALKADPDDVDPASIPMAKPALNYVASPAELTRRVSPGRILVELLLPVNFVVMLFVLIGHVLLFVTTATMAMGFFIMAPVWLILFGLITAHYGNVVEETGPVGADELPRPGRQVSFSEDFWNPWVHTLTALAVCFSPVWFFLHELRGTMLGLVLAGVAAAFGVFIWPAAFLTATCSGSLENMRPDRLLAVVAKSGLQYVVSLLAWVLGFAVYLGGLAAVAANGVVIFGNTKIPWYLQGYTVYPLLMLGIYLVHFACWHLGLIWRAHHEAFPWVNQRHARVTAREKMALNDANLAVKKQRLEERRAYRSMRGRV